MPTQESEKWYQHLLLYSTYISLTRLMWVVFFCTSKKSPFFSAMFLKNPSVLDGVPFGIRAFLAASRRRNLQTPGRGWDRGLEATNKPTNQPTNVTQPTQLTTNPTNSDPTNNQLRPNPTQTLRGGKIQPQRPLPPARPPLSSAIFWNPSNSATELVSTAWDRHHLRSSHAMFKAQNF